MITAAAHAGLTPRAVVELATVAVVVAVLAFAWWRLDIYRRPFAPCRRCKGSDRNRGSRASAYGLCPHGRQRVRFTGRRSADRQERKRK